jgi:hypothetical protein
LTINDVADVANFPDRHINLACFLLSEFAYYEYFAVIKSGWPSSFGEFGFPRFSMIGPGIRAILKSVVKFFRSSIPEPVPARLARW